jgi:hypothetical protein
MLLFIERDEGPLQLCGAERVAREAPTWLALDTAAELAAGDGFDKAVMVLRQSQYHLKRAIALDEGCARPVEGLIAPSAAG